MKAILLTYLLFLTPGVHTTDPPGKIFVFKGKFKSAFVLEGSGSYLFIDSMDKEKSFAFDDYYNQNIPYNFFDNEASINEDMVGKWFRITYKNYYESRSESEEKIHVSKIVSIKMIAPLK